MQERGDVGLLRSSPTSPIYFLMAAAYAIKAVRGAASEGRGELSGRIERRWQRDHLPNAIRDPVLDDQRLRNAICWSVFDCRAAAGRAQ